MWILADDRLTASGSRQEFLFHLFMEILKAIIKEPIIEFLFFEVLSTEYQMLYLEVFFLKLVPGLN
jgi:hypothetical protein